MEEELQPEQQLTKKQRRALAKQEKMAKQEHYSRIGSMKRWGIGVLVVVLAVFGIWWLASTVEAPGASTGDLAAGGWSKGNSEAAVTVLEFADFQCPACAAYQPLVARLAREFGDKVRFVYRHFPLSTIHPNAESAAAAAEAAGRQEKFWEMHDMLYERQNDWATLRNPDEQFAAYAETLGLNKEQFVSDYQDEALAEKISGDYRAGTLARVPGTPTFFINNEQIETPQGYEAFRALLVSRVGEPTPFAEDESTASTTEAIE